MVFARCLAVESDLFFTSTSARTTISSRANASHYNNKEPRPSSASSITPGTESSSVMPTFLNWTRKSSNSGSHTTTQKSPGGNSTNSNNNNSNQEPSPGSHGHQHHRHHKHRHSKSGEASSSSSSSHENKVTFHRGEKSFLAFHQNYAITRHLGEGSYSTVKQVTHRKRGGVYACKIVDKTALSAVDRVALSQEVQVLAKVRHDQIMKLYEVIEDDAKCYLIMELAEHGDLFDKIVKQGKFPEREAQKVAAALCEALAYCHANAIIHRDVKPENVLLSSDPHAIKLCDFGFAKQLTDATEKSVDSCGTPGYAAPEILDGKPYGLEVDVFSLGVVTYIMLCGYPPFPMKLSQLRTHRFNVRFPSKDWAHIDASVKEMITKMLHVKPDLRPKMAELQTHPWIQEGKKTLDEMREEAVQRQREEALHRKQLVADTIRKKLTSTTGFEVVKHGRQGQPHRTKLRLSPDGRVLSWQPKLLKRGLLKYHQNAKSFTSFFGFGGSSSSSSKGEKQVVAHPQISRLSSLEPTRSSSERNSGGRYSEPILCDDSTHSAIMQQQQELSIVATSSFSNGSQPRLNKADSTNSTTSTGSASWIDKKNWWRSFRRSPEKPQMNGAGSTERSASGGFSCAAFSLNNAPASRSLSSSSSCSVVSDSNDPADHSASHLSFTSEPSSPKPLSPGPSPTMSLGTTASMGSMVTPPMSPTASATTERMLDTSIGLKDIRSVTIGEDSPFFQTLTGYGRCQCNVRGCPSERTAAKTTSATDSGCDGSDGEADDAKDLKKNSDLNIAVMLTVATRYRELHLEFASEELRDAFAFLLEQATLPLEEVSQHQHSFIFRSPATEQEDAKSSRSTSARTAEKSSATQQQPQDNNNEEHYEGEEVVHNSNNERV